jgi:hypothetical protein
MIAPILKKKFSYWETKAKRLEGLVGSSDILNQKRAKRDAEREAQREYEHYVEEAYGLDSCDDGDILTWEKQFTEDGRVYSYTAMRAGGKWYMTGTDQTWTWFGLIEEIERDNIMPIQIYKVSEIEVFIAEEE